MKSTHTVVSTQQSWIHNEYNLCFIKATTSIICHWKGGRGAGSLSDWKLEGCQRLLKGCDCVSCVEYPWPQLQKRNEFNSGFIRVSLQVKCIQMLTMAGHPGKLIEIQFFAHGIIICLMRKFPTNFSVTDFKCVKFVLYNNVLISILIYNQISSM